MEISSELLLTATIATAAGLALGSAIAILGAQNAKNNLRRKLSEARTQLHQQQQNLDALDIPTRGRQARFDQQIEQLLEAMNNEENKTQQKVNAKKARGKKVNQEKDW